MTALRKVLIIYTGGTIGMKPTERGYQPETGYLTNLVRTLPMFNDEEARYEWFTPSVILLLALNILLIKHSNKTTCCKRCR